MSEDVESRQPVIIAGLATTNILEQKPWHQAPVAWLPISTEARL